MSEYTLEDIPHLHEKIAESFSDLLEPLLLKLPPLHEVLHEIPLIDESKQLKHRLPKCLEVFCPEIAQKSSNTPQQDGGYSQQISKPHLCCVFEKEWYIVHCI